MLRTMPGRFGRLRRKPQASSSSIRWARKFSSSRLGRDLRLVGHQRARRRRLGGGPPLIGQHHHRLRQIERHEIRVERIAHQRVGAAPCRRCRARRARARTGCRRAGRARADRAQFGGGAARRQHRLDDVARPRAGRETRCRSATASATLACTRRRVEDRGRRPRRCATPSPAASRRAARPAADGTARHWPSRARPRRYSRQAAAAPGSRPGCCRGREIGAARRARSSGAHCRVLPAVPRLPAPHHARSRWSARRRCGPPAAAAARVLPYFNSTCAMSIAP